MIGLILLIRLVDDTGLERVIRRLVRVPLLGDKKCQDKWQKVSKEIKIIVLKKTTVDKTLYPYGKVQLYLSHPDEKRLIEESKKHTRQSQKYSSNTLTYIFHCLAIYLFKEDECKTFVEKNNN